MDHTRRNAMTGMLATAAMMAGLPASAQDEVPPPAAVLHRWYRLILELVRHTPTYSPPVASRAFAYVGITAYEVVASVMPGLRSLAGQVNGLGPVPACDPTLTYDVGVALHAAMAGSVAQFFGNTGPTGQRAMAAMDSKQGARVATGVAVDVAARSVAHGQAVAAHILDWSRADGGDIVENMGFPYAYAPADTPGAWVPTSQVAQQQAPLLPDWGQNRTFAMPNGTACGLPAPPAYSEEPGSPFHAEAMEVYDTRATLTDEQMLIARFWSDDPMLSPTPPGHWVSIAMQILERDSADLALRVDVLARVAIAVADAFIACWATKFEVNLLRPVTYIRRVIEPKWEPLLNTPPFPEYPSGHSTQSAAAAAVLTAVWGEGYAFDDATHQEDGLPVRTFANFAAAADEAAISRLYGGIHFRAAIVQGLAQGRCVGAHAAALITRV